MAARSRENPALKSSLLYTSVCAEMVKFADTRSQSETLAHSRATGCDERPAGYKSIPAAFYWHVIKALLVYKRCAALLGEHSRFIHMHDRFSVQLDKEISPRFAESLAAFYFQRRSHKSSAYNATNACEILNRL